MKWWKIIKEPGAVLSGTPGLKSEPRYSDNKPKEKEVEKVIPLVAGKIVGDKKNGKK